MRSLKVVILVLLTVAVSSCVLTQKQQKRFLSKHCVGKDSIVVKDTTIYKDTTLYITVAGPVQYLENPCKLLCDSLGNLKKFEVKEKKNGIVSTIKSVGNSIVFDCEADSLKAIIKTPEHRRSTYNKSVKIVPQYCEREHRTKFDGFTYWYFLITAGLIVLYIALKCVKTYIEAWMPWLGKFL